MPADPKVRTYRVEHVPDIDASAALARATSAWIAKYGTPGDTSLKALDVARDALKHTPEGRALYDAVAKEKRQQFQQHETDAAARRAEPKP